MTYYSFYSDLLVCILWIANINQCTSTSGQNFSSSMFTNSLSFPYTIIESDNSIMSLKCNVSATENFTNLVHKSLHRRENLDVSTLQELMVRGFEILCLWTQPTKEKFIIQSQLKSATLLHLPDPITVLSEHGQFDFHNVTLNRFPNRDEKVTTNPLNEKCTHVFETTYQAKSNETTIRGEMLANGTRMQLVWTYQNVTLQLKNIKTATHTGHINSTRIRMEYNFDAFLAHTTHPQDVHFLLNSITPSLLNEIIAKDPSRRLTYAAIQQDVKIADFYKRSVLRLISSVLLHYIRTRYRQQYRFPVDRTPTLSESIRYIQIDGLDRCKVCDSNMQLVPRARHIAMKLKFSIHFDGDGDQRELTKLTIFQEGLVSQNRTIVVKKLLVQLEFSSSMQLETSHKNHFYLTAVKAEIIQEVKYRSAWYESFKSKLNVIFSELLTEIVLSWILYETN